MMGPFLLYRKLLFVQNTINSRSNEDETTSTRLF